MGLRPFSGPDPSYDTLEEKEQAYGEPIRWRYVRMGMSGRMRPLRF
jgi:hypothetical protein